MPLGCAGNAPFARLWPGIPQSCTSLPTGRITAPADSPRARMAGAAMAPETEVAMNCLRFMRQCTAIPGAMATRNCARDDFSSASEDHVQQLPGESQLRLDGDHGVRVAFADERAEPRVVVTKLAPLVQIADFRA